MKDQEARDPEREGNSVSVGRSLVKVAWARLETADPDSGFDQSNHWTQLFVKVGTLRSQVKINVSNAGPEGPIFN